MTGGAPALFVVMASHGSYADRRDWVAYATPDGDEAERAAEEEMRRARANMAVLGEWRARARAALGRAGHEAWYRGGGREAFEAGDPEPPTRPGDEAECVAVVRVPLREWGQWDVEAGAWREMGGEGA